jgi:hypothetical protein
MLVSFPLRYVSKKKKEKKRDGFSWNIILCTLKLFSMVRDPYPQFPVCPKGITPGEEEDEAATPANPGHPYYKNKKI